MADRHGSHARALHGEPGHGLGSPGADKRRADRRRYLDRRRGAAGHVRAGRVLSPFVAGKTGRERTLDAGLEDACRDTDVLGQPSSCCRAVPRMYGFDAKVAEWKGVYR